jgi:hypothetical protein
VDSEDGGGPEAAICSAGAEARCLRLRTDVQSACRRCGMPSAAFKTYRLMDHAVAQTHHILSTIMSPVHKCVDLTCIIGLRRRCQAPH